MKLKDLEPEWLSDDMFIFKNPTGGEDWLTCKRVPMGFLEQYELIYGPKEEGSHKRTGKRVGTVVVTTVEGMAWSFTGNDFETLTVSPSIDASASGNWHGFIRNGEIC